MNALASRIRTLALQSAALAALAVACVNDTALEPSGAERSARVALQASVAGLSAAVEYQVRVSITYLLAQGGRKALAVNPNSFPVSAGSSGASQELTIDLGSCLEDPDRADPVPDACRLTALVTLADASGDVASDSLDLGPVRPQDRVIPRDTLHLIPSYRLVITGGGSGTGSGVVTVLAGDKQPVLTCQVVEGQAAATGCDARYPLHAVVQLSATAAEGTALGAWDGDCAEASPSGPCELTMDGPRAVSAAFTLPPTTGDLELQVAGLPPGTAAAARVSNGSGFDRPVAVSGVITGLQPGDYTVTADPVLVASEELTYQPSPPTQTVTVSAGERAVAQVGYNPPTTGSLAVEITGLPTNQAADLTVTGPEFPQGRPVTAPELLTDLMPGDYRVIARSVTDAGGQPYDPAPSTQPAQVAAGLGASVAVVYGLPPATKLVFIQQPSDVASGAPIAPAVTIEVRDEQERIVPAFAGQIRLTLGGGAPGAKLGGATVRVPARGLATFDDLSVDLVGTQYTLTASAGSLTSGPSSPFNVTPAAVSADRTTVTLSRNTVRTCCDTALVTITARDAGGNPVPGASVSLDAPGLIVITPTANTGADGVSVVGVVVRTTGSIAVAAVVGGVRVVQAPTLSVIAGITFIRFTFVDEFPFRDIYVVNPDGSDPADITRRRFPEAGQPAWSPDGSKIAFSNDFADIIVIDADGANATNLTRGRLGGAFSPTWSPGGGRIAFTDGVEIYLVSVGTSEITPLTQGDFFRINTLSWSSTDRIAVGGLRTGEDSSEEIFVISSSNTDFRDLTRGRIGSPASPAWSPDGTRIAFTGTTGAGVDGIFVTDGTTGGELNDVTQGTLGFEGDQYSPTWSPDGSLIAFDGLDSGEINLVSSSGSTPRRLDNPVVGSEPDWR